MGAGLVYTEMVSAKALYYGSDNTKTLLRIADEEMPVAAQIFGRDAKIMAQVVEEHLNERDDICIIDVNMGCPANKIVKNGEGSALMKEPALAAEIIRELKSQNVTVSVDNTCHQQAFDYAEDVVEEYNKELSESLADLDIEYDTMKTMYDTLLEELRAQQESEKTATSTAAQDTGLLNQ